MDSPPLAQGATKRMNPPGSDNTGDSTQIGQTVLHPEFCCLPKLPILVHRHKAPARILHSEIFDCNRSLRATDQRSLTPDFLRW